MSFREMFKKTTYITVNIGDGRKEEIEEKKSHLPVDEGMAAEKEQEPSVPEGMWTKCSVCSEMVYTEDLIDNSYVCPKCGGYFRIDARTRISMVTDDGSFEEWDAGLAEPNPLAYPGYDEKIKSLKRRTDLDEAVTTGKGCIGGEEAVIAVCDTRFLMGSMGHVVGEKITRAVEKATEKRLPLIIFTCSGGARMQEGMISLMQMAKTSAALKRHSDAGLFYLTVLTDPTTGGVTASFAMLGDVILAEPGALVGFAGPRVIEQTIGQKLPEGFQRSEFIVKHGFADAIVERKELASTIAMLLRTNRKAEKVNWNQFKEELLKSQEENGLVIQAEYKKSERTPWEKVQTARSAERPTAMDYIEAIFADFYELHGDRQFRDDAAVVGGIAMFGEQPVTVIGQQKGRTTKENIERNFGMPCPEGYRKALRLMKQAEKFGRPIICFVDTPGAFCGMEAEERGQGEAIARNLMEMAGITVPILSVVIGEGGSGGALGMAVGNEVWMLENATYSVLSPEGFASILWKDSKRAEEASEVMKITADDLKELGVIERIIPEGEQATAENLPLIAGYMKRKIAGFFKRQQGKLPEQIVNERYERFRRY